MALYLTDLYGVMHIRGFSLSPPGIKVVFSDDSNYLVTYPEGVLVGKPVLLTKLKGLRLTRKPVKPKVSIVI